jgi:hypothetical protein
MTIEQHPEFSESEAALIERRQDQGVWNWTMGAAAIDGAFASPDATPVTSDTPVRKKRRPQPLETSGQMVSHDHAVQHAKEHPIDPVTQPEINRRGRALIEAALDETFGKDRGIRAIVDAVERELPIDPDNVDKSRADRETEITARLRKYFDTKA